MYHRLRSGVRHVQTFYQAAARFCTPRHSHELLSEALQSVSIPIPTLHYEPRSAWMLQLRFASLVCGSFGR